MEQLVENSKTFSEKTEFAQQKYIKKKKNKCVVHWNTRSTEPCQSFPLW